METPDVQPLDLHNTAPHTVRDSPELSLPEHHPDKAGTVLPPPGRVFSTSCPSLFRDQLRNPLSPLQGL